jgi:hypothetical protein
VAALSLVGVFALRPQLSYAADAWSMTGPACMPLVGSGGALDNVAHGSNIYGVYTTFATTGDNEVHLWCPVRLPQGTNVKTITVRAYHEFSGLELVRASFYAQPSVSSGGSWTLLGHVNATSSTTDANVTSAAFTSVKICNYKDGTPDCDTDTKVRTYFVLVKMIRSLKYTPKLYSVWIGNPPALAVDMSCVLCPIDCGRILEVHEAGGTLATEELLCLPPRSRDGLLP